MGFDLFLIILPFHSELENEHFLFYVFHPVKQIGFNSSILFNDL